MWVAEGHRPFAVVEDPQLLLLFRILYAKVKDPSASTVSRDMREIYAITRKHVGKILASHDGHLHLCLDGWTSPNVFSFLGVTVHRVLDGKANSFVLDFIRYVTP